MDSRERNFQWRVGARKVAGTLQRPYTKFLLDCTGRFFKRFKPNLFLVYDNTAKPDGVGAQVQRVLGIYSLAMRFGMSLVESKVTDIAIHPLDGLETEDDYRKYIEAVNENFTPLHALPFPGDARISTVRRLNFRRLWLSAAKTIFSTRPQVLMILEPYALSEIYLEDLVKVARQTQFFRKVELLRAQQQEGIQRKKLLAIHYRYGVGEMTVQSGEKLSRELPREHFSNLLALIQKDHNLNDFNVKVFTDAPSEAVSFIPPVQQGGLWRTSPKFSNGVLEISGVSDQDLALDPLLQIEVIRGGSPVDAMLELASADILVMSRSSFSYVAAIYNSAKDVFVPADFWHRAFPKWIKI